MKTKSIRIETNCLNCKVSVLVKENDFKKYGRGKYCSRKCCDIHKKELYSNGNHPVTGRKATKEEKEKRSDIAKETWKNFRPQILSGMKKFVKIHGHNPGQSDLSKQKRKITFIKKYGVDHNWKVKEIRKKCDDTCIKLYGKSAWELFVDSALYGHDTKIELKIQTMLNELKILYVTHFQVSYHQSYREYDIYIPTLNLLIEIDGDFWHANQNTYFGKLYEIQIRNRENDILKNELAKFNGYNLLRLWESDINKENFESFFREKLITYGYNKN